MMQPRIDRIDHARARTRGRIDDIDHADDHDGWTIGRVVRVDIIHAGAGHATTWSA